jgi:flagellar biosynthesis protein FlhG
MTKNKSVWLDSFRTKSKSAQVFAVCSGKGGVGKSSIAIRLAKMYAEDFKKVLLIDCDFNLSNSSIKLGLSLKDNFLKVVKDPSTLLDHVESHHGFDILPGCNGDVEVLESRISITKSIVDILGMYSHYYDMIILDAPAGASKEALNLITLADFRIFIITPEPSSITDSYSLFKLSAEHYGCSNNLMIINRYQEENQWKRVKSIMIDTTKKFTKDSFYHIGAIPEIKINHSDFDKYFIETADSSISASFANIKNNLNEMILLERLVDMKNKMSDETSRINLNFE